MAQTPRPDAPRKARTAWLDCLRGFTVLNMIAYHASWDLVYIFGKDWPWYHGTGAYIWQQCICCTFITLSGFCAAFSRHPVKRGLIVSGIGLGVMAVTILFMPEDMVKWGVLTLIGAGMLLIGALRRYLQKLPAWAGLPLCVLLFGMTRHTAAGYWGLWRLPLVSLPGWLYRNDLTALFGFPGPDFYSTDYFALLPWVFLFLSGFYAYHLFGKQVMAVPWKGFAPLNFIGRHALEIYVVHQPVIYGILWLLEMIGRK